MNPFEIIWFFISELIWPGRYLDRKYGDKKKKKAICLRCSFTTSSRLLFEFHLLVARHNYLIWGKK